MDLGLTNKIAMVGGASKGLGYAVARALAAEGALVSIASRDRTAIEAAAAALSRDTGSPVLAVAADLSRADAIDRWHADTVARFGGVDLLFANTGGPPAGTALAFDDAAWQTAFDLLLMSVVRTVRLVVPSMRARGGGAILVGTSSTVKEPFPNLALSNVMRAGVTALVKTLSGELATDRIRVNTLLPGRIATDRLNYLDEANAKKAGITAEVQRDRALATIPMGRYGDPGEFGRAGAFLLSDAAAYITGAALQVDGGLLKGLLWIVSLARKALLALSTNAWLRERATRTAFVRRAVSAFMPGERLDDAMAAARAQQGQGIDTIFTRLGENLTKVEEAEEVTQHYLDVLDKVQAAGLRAQISVKPTQLGLDLDRELCFRNLRRLVERADARGNTVWIDMESSPYVDPTLDLFRRARALSPRVGIALQAYLYRTAQDVESLVPLGAAIRLVKGAYLEPASVAIPKKADVDENFYRLACRLLGEDAQHAGGQLHIATHDPLLADRLAAFIDEHRVPTSAYEYAMLYGIQRPLQQRLVAAGRPVRVLIAYGEYWFPWYMRRLAERPANVWFVVKNIVR